MAAFQLQEENQSEHSWGRFQNCFQFTCFISNLRFLLMGKKWLLKGETWMFPIVIFKAIKWSFLSNMIFFTFSIFSLALSKNQKRPLKNDDFFLYLICDLFMFLLLYAFELSNNYSYVARRRADLSYILWRGDYLKCENERKYKNCLKGFTTENMGPRPSSNPGYTLFLIMHSGIFFFFWLTLSHKLTEIDNILQKRIFFFKA